jgi:uncharacterized protein (DUF1499 family)
MKQIGISFMILLLCSAFAATGCSAGADGRFPTCPGSPNCVSSLDENPDRKVEPLRFEGSAEAAWEALRTAVESLPRNTITRADAESMRVEFSSRLFGFVDDLRFVMLPEETGVIHVMSSSRTGYYDFGVNRKRVEEIRKRFQEALAGS